MIELKIFVADANYPSKLTLNSFKVFAEVARGDQKRLFKFSEISSHKCALRLIEWLEANAAEVEFNITEKGGI